MIAQSVPSFSYTTYVTVPVFLSWKACICGFMSSL